MNREMSKKGLYIGTGAGIAIFTISGLLPGSFIGGAIGISIATKLFGSPLGISLLSKVIVAVSMLLGVITAGVLFLIGASSLGWLIGSLIDAARNSGTVGKKATVDSK